MCFKEIYIFKVLGILSVSAGLRFAVTEVIIGEVADKAAGKRWQAGQALAFVPGQNVPQHRRWVVGMQGHVPGAQGSVHARYLHLGVIAQKRVAAPLFVGLGIPAGSSVSKRF